MPGMEPKRIAAIHAATRIVVGGALVVAPEAASAGWIGKHANRKPVTVLARALGVRDAALGMGLLRALGRPEEARPWLAACAAADMVDLGATLAVRDELPTPGAVAISAVAGASALLCAWLLSALD